MSDEHQDHSHDEASAQAAAGQEHAQQAAQDFKSAASAKIDDLKQAYGAKVDDLKATATAKANDLKDAAAAKAGEYREAANQKAEELRGQAEAAWGDAKVRARTYQEDGEAYVRENPTRALLMAIGAGFVLGLIIKK